MQSAREVGECFEFYHLNSSDTSLYTSCSIKPSGSPDSGLGSRRMGGIRAA